MKKEIWKDIPGYEKLYQVSNLGNIRSLDKRIKCKGKGTRLLKGKVKKQDVSVHGYCQINLTREKGTRKFFVHRLVLMAFVGDSKLPVNHKNGNKLDNRLENIEYCTYSENTKHAYKNGLLKPLSSEKAHKSKLNKKKVLQIRKLYSQNESEKTLACKYNVSQSTINRIVNNITWRDI